MINSWVVNKPPGDCPDLRSRGRETWREAHGPHARMLKEPPVRYLPDYLEPIRASQPQLRNNHRDGPPQQHRPRVDLKSRARGAEVAALGSRHRGTVPKTRISHSVGILSSERGGTGLDHPLLDDVGVLRGAEYRRPLHGLADLGGVNTLEAHVHSMNGAVQPRRSAIRRAGHV